MLPPPSRFIVLVLTMGQGIQPLTESNRDKATHQQMIDSMSSKSAR